MIDSIIYIHTYFEKVDESQKIYIIRKTYINPKYEIAKEMDGWIGYYLMVKNDSVYIGNTSIDFDGVESDTIHFYPYYPLVINETFNFSTPSGYGYMTYLRGNIGADSLLTRVYEGREIDIYATAPLFWTVDNRYKTIKMETDGLVLENKGTIKLSELPDGFGELKTRTIDIIHPPSYGHITTTF